MLRSGQEPPGRPGPRPHRLSPCPELTGDGSRWEHEEASGWVCQGLSLAPAVEDLSLPSWDKGRKDQAPAGPELGCDGRLQAGHSSREAEEGISLFWTHPDSDRERPQPSPAGRIR